MKEYDATSDEDRSLKTLTTPKKIKKPGTKTMRELAFYSRQEMALVLLQTLRLTPDAIKTTLKHEPGLSILESCILQHLKRAHDDGSSAIVFEMLKLLYGYDPLNPWGKELLDLKAYEQNIDPTQHLANLKDVIKKLEHELAIEQAIKANAKDVTHDAEVKEPIIK